MQGHTKSASQLPLRQKRIVITRTREQASELREQLFSLGAEVIEIPTIVIRDPPSWDPLDDAIRRLDEFDFIILTSTNGVRSFLSRLAHCGRQARDLESLSVGAIGPATANELAKSGVRVDFVPREYRAEGLLEVLGNQDLTGKAFLIPRARVARDIVPRVLTERGARVAVVEAYETVAPDFPPGEIERLLTPPPDAITFTSSSTVSNFAKLVGEDRLSDVLRGIAVASIGPITSGTIRKLGLEVMIEAAEFTTPGLVRAISKYFIAAKGDRNYEGTR